MVRLAKGDVAMNWLQEVRIFGGAFPDPEAPVVFRFGKRTRRFRVMMMRHPSGSGVSFVVQRPLHLSVAALIERGNKASTSEQTVTVRDHDSRRVRVVFTGPAVDQHIRELTAKYEAARTIGRSGLIVGLTLRTPFSDLLAEDMADKTLGRALCSVVEAFRPAVQRLLEA